MIKTRERLHGTNKSFLLLAGTVLCYRLRDPPVKKKGFSPRRTAGIFVFSYFHIFAPILGDTRQ
jgi:hypothetical protein